MAAAQRNRTKTPFQRDFAALRASLAREARLGKCAVVMTPERLIVQLHLTPEAVRSIESKTGTKLGWFEETYSALKRHGLFPKAQTDWEDWLAEFRSRDSAVAP